MRPNRATALVALLLLAPVPTIGVTCALYLMPGASGQVLFTVAKIWLVVFPAVWYLAVEHGSSEMLARMGKRQNLDAIERVVGWCRKYGVRSVIFFIVGYPGETEARWREGWAFARKLRNLGATRFEVFLAKPYPGTAMYEECKNEGFLAYPDSENVVYDMDFAGVQTPDFSMEEARGRRAVMKRDLNPWTASLKAHIADLLPDHVFYAVKKLQERWIGPRRGQK